MATVIVTCSHLFNLCIIFYSIWTLKEILIAVAAVVVLVLDRLISSRIWPLSGQFCSQ